MRKGLFSLMFLLIASGLAFSLTYFGPGTPLDCSAGQVDITTPDTYSWNLTGATQMNQGSQEICLNISTDNVIIDCIAVGGVRGTILGTPTSIAAINLEPGVQNFTLKNCRVDNHTGGMPIQAPNTTNISLGNNEISNFESMMIRIGMEGGLNIVNNTFYNSPAGFAFLSDIPSGVPFNVSSSKFYDLHTIILFTGGSASVWNCNFSNMQILQIITQSGNLTIRNITARDLLGGILMESHRGNASLHSGEFRNMQQFYFNAYNDSSIRNSNFTNITHVQLNSGENTELSYTEFRDMATYAAEMRNGSLTIDSSKIYNVMGAFFDVEKSASITNSSFRNATISGMAIIANGPLNTSSSEFHNMHTVALVGSSNTSIWDSNFSNMQIAYLDAQTGNVTIRNITMLNYLAVSIHSVWGEAHISSSEFRNVSQVYVRSRNDSSIQTSNFTNMTHSFRIRSEKGTEISFVEFQDVLYYIVETINGSILIDSSTLSGINNTELTAEGNVSLFNNSIHSNPNSIILNATGNIVLNRTRIYNQPNYFLADYDSALLLSELWLGFDETYGIHYNSIQDAGGGLVDVNSENLIVEETFVSMDSTDAGISLLNVPANITAWVWNCTNITFYNDTVDVFPQVAWMISLNGEEFIPAYQSCGGSTVTYQVDGFSAYLAHRPAPPTPRGDDGRDKGEDPECRFDTDCLNECYYCSIANGLCMLRAESECGLDSDCASGEECIECTCTLPIEEPEEEPEEQPEPEEEPEAESPAEEPEPEEEPEAESPAEEPEPEEEPPPYPIIQTDVPSVEEPIQPVPEETVKPEDWPWFLLLLPVLALILIYFFFLRK